jgi:YD repeat-containing protein
VAGNLTRITDPDGSSRQFSYDARHRLTSQTSKRGFVTTYGYDFAGRNVLASRADGSTRQVDASQTMGLADFTTGLGTEAQPLPVVRPEQLESALYRRQRQHHPLHHRRLRQTARSRSMRSAKDHPHDPKRRRPPVRGYPRRRGGARR